MAALILALRAFGAVFVHGFVIRAGPIDKTDQADTNQGNDDVEHGDNGLTNG